MYFEDEVSKNYNSIIYCNLHENNYAITSTLNVGDIDFLSLTILSCMRKEVLNFQLSKNFLSATWSKIEMLPLPAVVMFFRATLM